MSAATRSASRQSRREAPRDQLAARYVGRILFRPQGRRPQLHQVVRRPQVQQKWWELGGYSAHKAGRHRAGFPESAPFAPDFLKSMEIVVDFWAEPSYAELLLDMTKRVHD